MTTKTIIDDNGVIKQYDDNGLLHSDGNYPSIEYPDKICHAWHYHGKLHRLGAPALITNRQYEKAIDSGRKVHSYGIYNKHYYVNGKLYFSINGVDHQKAKSRDWVTYVHLNGTSDSIMALYDTNHKNAYIQACESFCKNNNIDINDLIISYTSSYNTKSHYDIYGQYHNKLNVPAIIYISSKEYYWHGKKHRLDGPALEYDDNKYARNHYFINGIQYDNNEFISDKKFQEFFREQVHKYMMENMLYSPMASNEDIKQEYEDIEL